MYRQSSSIFSASRHCLEKILKSIETEIVNRSWDGLLHFYSFTLELESKFTFIYGLFIDEGIKRHELEFLQNLYLLKEQEEVSIKKNDFELDVISLFFYETIQPLYSWLMICADSKSSKYTKNTILDGLLSFESSKIKIPDFLCETVFSNMKLIQKGLSLLEQFDSHHPLLIHSIVSKNMDILSQE